MVSECQHGPTSPYGTCEFEGCNWRAKSECETCGEQLCLGHVEQHKHAKSTAKLADAAR